MRRPALFILAAPHLHGLRIVLNLSIRSVELQFAVQLPCDIGELKHGDGNVSYSDRRVELLSLANSRDKVREVHIGHRIAAGKVRRRGRLRSEERRVGKEGRSRWSPY